MMTGMGECQAPVLSQQILLPCRPGWTIRFQRQLGGRHCQALSGRPDVLEECCSVPPTQHHDCRILQARLCSCCGGTNPKAVPANCSCGRPSSRRASLTMLTNRVLVSGVPSGNKKNGPGDDSLCTMNAHTAVTGHSVSPVHPTTMSIPSPNWSVMDRRRCTLMARGLVQSSMATSPQPR